jgi:hypothetical protein
MPEIAEVFPAKDEVEERAYEIFLARGAHDGDDVADWLEAEKELRREARQEAVDCLATRAEIAAQEDDEETLHQMQVALIEEMLQELHAWSKSIDARAGGSMPRFEPPAIEGTSNTLSPS